MKPSSAQSVLNQRFAIILGAVTLAALALRLWGIDARSISHGEVYVPGIPLIAGISEPPPRHDFYHALLWHFHAEPHPIGWYLSMLGWTDIFGTSPAALRIPSALYGAASVVIVGLIGRRVYTAPVGLLAAGILALHGFHIFWSQTARMYTAGMFWGLLSVWLLLRLSEQSRPRPILETAYVLTVLAGILSVELFWPFVFLQVGWAAFCLPVARGASIRDAARPSFHGVSRILQIQSVALMLSAPSLLHSLYQARGGGADEQSLEFLIEYFGFGFLFAREEPVPPMQLPASIALTICALGIALVAGAAFAEAEPRKATPASDDLPRWLPPIIAVLCAAFMVWLASIAYQRNAALFPMAYRRNAALFAMAILPLLSLTIPALARVCRTAMASLAPRLNVLITEGPTAVYLVWLPAIVGPLGLFVLSGVASVLAARAFLVFVPYLLILIAAGATAAWRNRLLGAGVALVLALLAVSSVVYSSKKPGSPRDYQALGTALAARLEPGDLVLIRANHWEDTPLFYYVRDAKFVTGDWRKVLDENPSSRVWLVTWPSPGEVVNDARRDAVRVYQRVDTIRALGASAELFQRSVN